MEHGAGRGWRHKQTQVTEGLWDIFRGVDLTPRVTESY